MNVVRLHAGADIRGTLSIKLSPKNIYPNFKAETASTV